MDQLWAFFKLGFFHILDWSAHDHILFLIVLIAAYTMHEWKRILRWITLFTIGHTVALLLSANDVMQIDTTWVAFLIPLIILITACYAIFSGGKKIRNEKINIPVFMSTFFGVVHGLGFSDYFTQISGTKEASFLSIIEFGIGVEIAQILVAIGVLVLAFIFQSVLRFSKRDWVLVISSIIIGLTLPILSENWLL